MALFEIQRAQVTKGLTAFCESRVPAAVRNKMRIGFRLKGSEVVLFEERGAELALPLRVEDRARDEPSALVALLRWLVAEGQADEALAAAVREERGPRRVLSPRRDRQLLQSHRVGPGREPDPYEEPARAGPRHDVGGCGPPPNAS